MLENNGYTNPENNEKENPIVEPVVEVTPEPAAEVTPEPATEVTPEPAVEAPKVVTPPIYNNNWQRDDYKVAPPVYEKKSKEKKPKRKGALIAVLLASTVLISGLLGFGGGVLAMKLFGGYDIPETKMPPTITSEQLAAADADSFNAAAVAAVGLDSVVEITTEVAVRGTFIGNYITEGAGSGVIIREDGYIVTNNHVIEGATKVTVRTRDGKSHSATIVGHDEKTDLAVIKIEVNGLTAARYGDSEKLVIGQRVLAIGNPLGELGGTVTEGIISALDRELTVENQTMTLLQTDASVNPGNSGGGLFDGNGTLVGIVNAKSSGSGVEGLGFAIPIDNARVVIDELIEHGYVTGRGEAGIEIAYIDERTAYLYRLGDEGVYISAVIRGSAAERAGLLSGDRISEINGEDIETAQDAVNEIQKHKAGATVEFEIVREGKEMTVKVTLDEQKPTLASLF